MTDKFRSIKAFKKFEEESQSRQRSLEAEEQSSDAQAPSPLRVMARLKERSGRVRRRDLADDLGVPPPALEGPLLRLFKEGLVTVQPGVTQDDDVILIAG